MDLKKESIELHKLLKGKIEIKPRVKIKNSQDLSLAYTPGVAFACLEIKDAPEKSYLYTRRHNMVAVITDGTAVLGLGDIGPLAGMPVMEGKCLLFKTFAGVDAFPLSIKSKNVDEIVRTIYLLSDSFGGINLEDISAPRCFEIENKLKEICDIPIFHDDQHGTAIVVSAALLNALKIVDKKIEDVSIVINGAGAAGISIAKFIHSLGARYITLCDRDGILTSGNAKNSVQASLAQKLNSHNKSGLLKDAFVNSDVFIGVSGPHCVTKDMVRSMADKSIVFPLSNPTPEISREDALDAGATVVGTGSSSYPNQINNVLAFPGIFRGTLDAKAKEITNEMMVSACYAIASAVPSEKLSPDYIIPYAFDKKVHKLVAQAVKRTSKASKK
ncbi:MAG: NADP-dependent malic enzyme [Firmicutes bacterium]|nr:NADP-dependent malic enzyme [Bacillota bacterium]